MTWLAGVVDRPADVQRVFAEEARIRLGDFPAQAAADLGVGQSGVELRIVQLVVAKGGEELERAVARQLALVGVAAAAARKVLANHQGRGQCQARYAGQRRQAPAPGQARRGKGAADRPLQGQAESQGQGGEQAEQGEERVGLHDVVNDLVGVDQVIHCDEVEAHAELVPEQPLGHRGKQHRVEAQHQQQAQAEAVPAAGPDLSRAEREIQRQRHGGKGQVGQVVDRAFGIDAQDVERAGGRLLPVRDEQRRAGQHEGAEPEAQKQGEITKLSMSGKRHRMIHG
jgi:hypothetical protein